MASVPSKNWWRQRPYGLAPKWFKDFGPGYRPAIRTCRKICVRCSNNASFSGQACQKAFDLHTDKPHRPLQASGDISFYWLLVTLSCGGLYMQLSWLEGCEVSEWLLWWDSKYHVTAQNFKIRLNLFSFVSALKCFSVQTWTPAVRLCGGLLAFKRERQWIKPTLTIHFTKGVTCFLHGIPHIYSKPWKLPCVITASSCQPALCRTGTCQTPW